MVLHTTPASLRSLRAQGAVVDEDRGVPPRMTMSVETYCAEQMRQIMSGQPERIGVMMPKRKPILKPEKDGLPKPQVTKDAE